MTIVRPTLTYGYDIWPMTVNSDQTFRSFENKEHIKKNMQLSIP